MNRIHYTECTGCGRMLRRKPDEILSKRCPVCHAQNIIKVGQTQPERKKQEGGHE